jgi:hypothetical protein
MEDKSPHLPPAAAAGLTAWRDRVLAISDSQSPVQTRLSPWLIDDADLFAAREDARPPGWLNPYVDAHGQLPDYVGQGRKGAERRENKTEGPKGHEERSFIQRVKEGNEDLPLGRSVMASSKSSLRCLLSESAFVSFVIFCGFLFSLRLCGFT